MRMTKPSGASETTIREEIDYLMVQAEILETVLFMKKWGLHISGTELVTEPDGKSIMRFDQGART